MCKFLGICLASVLAAILCQSVCGQECTSAGLRKFDSNVANLITIGIPGKRFPENKGKDLKDFCKQSTVYTNEIESYKDRCLKDAGKQATSVIVFAIKNVIKQFCSKDSKRLTLLITATPCLNKGSTEINKCNTRLIDSYLGILNEPDEKKRIPFLCCEYAKSFGCMETRLSKVSGCGETQIEASLDFVKSVSGDFTNLFCGDYTDGSDKCSKLGLPPKKRKNQRRTKSFAIPMIEIMQSFSGA